MRLPDRINEKRATIVSAFNWWSILFIFNVFSFAAVTAVAAAAASIYNNLHAYSEIYVYVFLEQRFRTTISSILANSAICNRICSWTFDSHSIDAIFIRSNEANVTLGARHTIADYSIWTVFLENE